MKAMRFAVLVLAVAMLAGPAGTGCSCKSGRATEDRDLLPSPTQLDFGTIEMGSSLPLQVELKHIGTEGVIHLSSIELDDLSSDFSLVLPDKMTLAAGESVWVTVTYTPTGASSSDGALLIHHDVESRGNLTRVPITANGLVGDLLVQPNPIDFGQVESGKDALLDVMVQNYGSAAITMKSVTLRLDGSADFSIESYAFPEGVTGFPFDLAPNAAIGLVMKYQPTVGGTDASTLVVEGDSEGGRRAWSFDVKGEEMGPLLVATPGELNFGGVQLNVEKELLLEVQNQGNANLVVAAGGLTLWPPDTTFKVVVKDQPAEDVVIAPNGTPAQFHVAWTPKEVVPDDGNPLCTLMITSNDPNNPTAIPVYGRVDAPILSVIPDTIDMGFGAQMTPVERHPTLQNAGSGVLHITKMEIVDPSETQYGTEFTLDTSACAGEGGDACTMAGNSSLGFLVVFTNRGPDSGQVTATLRITSNYAGHESMDVPIIAKRSGAPVCNVALVPGVVNFGVIAWEWPKELKVNLVNIGTGYCTFQMAMITDCTTGMMGGATCNAPFVGQPSQIFQLLDKPSVVKNGLAPGSVTSMTVRFVPKGTTPLFSVLNTWAGLLAVRVKDEVQQKIINLPAGSGDPITYTNNVIGSAGIAKISVMPGDVDFGVTTIGCFSKTYKICVYNSGNAPLTVDDIALKGCSPEFKVKNIPKLPLNVVNGMPKCFEAVYAPQDEGVDQCIVRIDSTDKSAASIAVQLKGSGTRDPHQVDEFTQVTGQEVDILFIIDDSGSMGDDQALLAESFGDFIADAAVWNNDYHIGGISVDVIDGPVIGRLNRGDVKVTPRFMTPTSGGDFAKLVDYTSAPPGGENSSSQESSLQAAQAALSAPLATSTGVACSKDSDCTSDPNICPDPTSCAYGCMQGVCGGFNAGFLRDNAQLEMIALSDEEDQSSASLPFYIDFMKNIKGWYNVDMMHFNAIAGIVGGQAQSCTAPGGDEAGAGYRYLEAAKQTGGKTGSICSSSYSTVMNEIADVSFHPKVQFFLSRLADPATVSVKVNAQACAAGWRYDAPSNSVIFDLQGACMPGPGDKIRIEYDTLCLTS